MSGSFKVIRWYRKVQDDIANVPDACEYYKGVILEGEKHIAPVGDLEQLQIEQPGLQSYYGAFYKDAMAIAKYLDELYKVEYAKKYAWFHSPAARQEYGDVKHNDVKNYVGGDDVLWAIKQFHLMADHAKENLETLCDALVTRRYFITNLLEIKKHNLEYVVVDATKENVDA